MFLLNAMFILALWKKNHLKIRQNLDCDYVPLIEQSKPPWLDREKECWSKTNAKKASPVDSGHRGRRGALGQLLERVPGVIQIQVLQLVGEVSQVVIGRGVPGTGPPLSSSPTAAAAAARPDAQQVAVLGGWLLKRGREKIA